MEAPGSGGTNYTSRQKAASLADVPAPPRSVYPRRKFERQTTVPQDDHMTSEAEDDSDASMAASEELEMDDMVSDTESDADEESGLTGAESKKLQRSKKEHNQLDVRIGGGGNPTITREEKKAADRYVIRTLIVNVILIGTWYFFSLSISIYNKWMFSSDHLDFHFPLFTTSLHMLVQFGLASLVLLTFPRARPQAAALRMDYTAPPGEKKPIITPFFWATRLLPCGTATSLDIGLGNTSLRYISLTFLTMCKSSSLTFVLLFAFLFRLEAPSWKLCLIILAMTGGVVMMVAGETAFDLIGFVLVMAASFFSGFRWALTQILLLRHPATGNPFATLFFLTPIMFVCLFVLACGVEGIPSVIAGFRILMDAKGTWQAILLLLFPGLLAFGLITSEFALLKRTSVVTLSICGIFKEVVTILAAGIVFHDPLTPINVSGLLVTIGSIAAYNYLKITKMRKEARKEMAVEPVTRKSMEPFAEPADGSAESSGSFAFAVEDSETESDVPVRPPDGVKHRPEEQT